VVWRHSASKAEPEVKIFIAFRREGGVKTDVVGCFVPTPERSTAPDRALPSAVLYV
jgi:hypothetical protein